MCSVQGLTTTLVFAEFLHTLNVLLAEMPVEERVRYISTSLTVFIHRIHSKVGSKDARTVRSEQSIGSISSTAIEFLDHLRYSVHALESYSINYFELSQSFAICW
jgi:hypothetical protein